jgi:hypothetical protein
LQPPATNKALSPADCRTYSGAAFGGWGKFDTSRNIALPGYAVATGHPDTTSFGALLRAAYTFGRDEFYVRPALELSAIRVRTSAYQESGAGPLDLDVSAASQSTFIATPMVEVGGRVAVGEGKYLMVDKGMGVPILPDVDILAYAPVRGGKVSTASIDLLGSLRKRIPFFQRKAGKTDDLVQAHVMNQTIRKHTKDSGFYDQTQHSETGGSRTYIGPDGKPKWNPSGKDLQERLIMFVKGRCIVFDDWHAYRGFCLKNNMRHMCPWDF